MSNLLAQLMSMDDEPRKQARKATLRSPFGYPGSKERSLKDILQYLPIRESYVEHCGGTGIVLMSRPQSKLEVFNDAHSGITAFYKCIADRNKYIELAKRISLGIHSRELFEHYRDTWKDQEDVMERAARWYIMLSQSFSQKGYQFGRSVKPPGLLGQKLRNSIESFDAVHHRLANVQVENLDWRICMQDYDTTGTVHYVDPPYWGVQDAYDDVFTTNDHIELCERAMRLKGFIAISGYDRPDHPYNKFAWDEKYHWEVSVSITTQAFQESSNTMNADISRGKKAEETLWIRR